MSPCKKHKLWKNNKVELFLRYTEVRNIASGDDISFFFVLLRKKWVTEVGDR